MLRQRRIESNSPARICPIPKPIAKPITIAFRSDRIKSATFFCEDDSRNPVARLLAKNFGAGEDRSNYIA
jgi:hypothetical protein